MSVTKALPNLQSLNERELKSGGPRVVSGLGILGDAFKKKNEKSREDRERKNKFFGKKMALGEMDMNELIKVFTDIEKDDKAPKNIVKLKENVKAKMHKILHDHRSKASAEVAGAAKDPADHNVEVMVSRLDMADLLFDPISNFFLTKFVS